MMLEQEVMLKVSRGKMTKNKRPFAGSFSPALFYSCFLSRPFMTPSGPKEDAALRPGDPFPVALAFDPIISTLFISATGHIVVFP